ncbi:redox-active disulfide protein 2 [Pedobacter jamesrossensis]|uniref:Redox-active disulfide protein 2 n=1 Tax=Pedobacter jamesrossensis TaxID=1908238 RepID=A0ABV8NUE5_9SPHI
MKTKKYSEMSNNELLKSKKSIKTITAMLAGMLLFLFVVNIFLAFKKGFSGLTVIPIALLPIVIININTVKEINKELDSRNISE